MVKARALTVLFLAAAALQVRAADQLLPGTSLVLRQRASGAQRAAFVVRDSSFVAPTAGGPDDPRTVGASLEIRANSGESATLDLPSSGWSLNNAGTAYRYQGGSGDDVKVSVLRDGARLKVVARTTGITLDEPSQGSVALIFKSGGLRVCAEFGGTIVADVAGRFVARHSAAPGACPAPPSTTSTSSTSTSTSTTSSTTLVGLCGNSTINTGEQCDPPGSSCGGTATCSSDCTCPCDFLDTSTCLYPFPSDYLTVEDPSSNTGRRVHFAQAGMPRNNNNIPMNAVDYNSNDGFSPGASMLLHVPNVDLTMTGAVPITDIARSLDAGAPIVLVNAGTLAHHPFWAELDANAPTEPERSLILHPAVNLDEGGRYIVALRNMKDGSGAIIPPSADFLAYRDNTPTGDPVKEARRPHMEDLFTTLAAAGVPRGDLYLAWDFTVASSENLTERLLFMRDDAFARLGSATPAFTVTSVENDVDARIYRRVTGTYQVDRYVNSTTAPARLVLDSSGMPVHQATTQPASFICLIPRAALADAVSTAVPARPSIYGHGLLGSNDEVNAGNVRDMANEHNFVFCATKWIGMADEDVGNAVNILLNLANFPSFPDRQQQGMLNQLFLARLMINPHGFVSDPAFQDASGNPVIDTSEVFYDGNSQGGIFGGTVMAIAQDITRGVLGVPGMNYSLLLTRSSDFGTYSLILYPAYPDKLTRPLLLALIQMLWDRSEPNGYARHIMNDPLPGTPSHKVLLHLAFGDHQVANVATEIETRTIGASIHQPAIAAGRHSDVDPYYLIPAIPSYPFDGSALVVWDSGAATPPITNTAPTIPPDPHSVPRSTVAARQQKSDFLQTGGMVTDVCSGAPCTAP
jgi:hypothetical protein